MKNALIFVVIFASVIVPFVVAGLYYWAIMFGVIAAVLGLFEFLAWKKSGDTLSERFWVLKEKNPGLAWSIIGVLALAWIGLLLHLVM